MTGIPDPGRASKLVADLVPRISRQEERAERVVAELDGKEVALAIKLADAVDAGYRSAAGLGEGDSLWFAAAHPRVTAIKVVGDRRVVELFIGQLAGLVAENRRLARLCEQAADAGLDRLLSASPAPVGDTAETRGGGSPSSVTNAGAELGGAE